jgi:hypothetical protein
MKYDPKGKFRNDFLNTSIFERYPGNSLIASVAAKPTSLLALRTGEDPWHIDYQIPLASAEAPGVPEPTTWALFAAGLLALACTPRRRLA